MENIFVGHIPSDDRFCNEHLASIKVSYPWFADYANISVAKVMPS
jgi:hypothetical protein